MDWKKELSTPVEQEAGAPPAQDWKKELAPAAPIREVTNDRLRMMLQPTYRTQPKEEAVQEAFPTTAAPAPERPGEGGAFVGELAGGLAAALTGPLVHVARPIAAGAGAAIGSQVERVARGMGIDEGQAINEAILSFVPEFAESALRGMGRGLARITRGGQDLRLDEAARIARTGGKRVFNPPEKKQSQRLFELLDTHEATEALPSPNAVFSVLDPTEQKRLMRELSRLDPMVAAAITDPAIALSPKQMQNFRSLIGQQAEMLRNSGRPGAARTRQLLLDVQRAVDQDIDDFMDQIDLPGAAGKAREAYHRIKSAERMERLLTTSPVTKSTQGGDILQFNLDRLDNILKDGKTKDARMLATSLQKIPGAWDEFQAFRQEIKSIVPDRVIEISDVSGLRRFAPAAVIDRMLSFVLTHPTGQKLLRNTIVYGRGRVSVNQLALIANSIRRANVGAGAPEVYLAPGAVSGQSGGQTASQPGLAIQPGELQPLDIRR